MKKIFFIISLFVIVSAGSGYEFDINSLGKLIENYIQNNNKQIKLLKNKIKLLNSKIMLLNKQYTKNFLMLNNRIIELENKIKKLKSKNDNNLTKVAVKNTPIKIAHKKSNNIKYVATKKGIIVFSKPYYNFDYFVKKYPYKTKLKIEYCNKYGWCKIYDKEEFVAGYLLK